MLKLEPRPQASKLWTYGSPLLALAFTVLIGVALFIALGKDPVRGLQVFFWEPIKTQYAMGELMVKATPLLLIALGLAVCFRSNVWNIGAEGQFIVGAIVGSILPITFYEWTSPLLLPLMLAMGAIVSTLTRAEWLAIGLALAFRFSQRLGLCSGQDATRVSRHLDHVVPAGAGDRRAEGGDLLHVDGLARRAGEAPQGIAQGRQVLGEIAVHARSPSRRPRSRRSTRGVSRAIHCGSCVAMTSVTPT